jgi:hypothetical protein
MTAARPHGDPGRPWFCFAIPALVAATSCAALYWIGRSGWPGETGVSAIEFCERLRDAGLKQPANSWSNAGFVLVGLWTGWIAMRDREAQIAAGGPPLNRMRASNVSPTLYASLAVLLGPGSAAMHGSTTRWGATADVASMFIWASFIVAYALARLWDRSERTFLIGYTALACLLAAPLVAQRFPFDINVAFGALVASFVVLEFVLHRRRTTVSSDTRWLVRAAVLFLAAFGIWLPSHTGGPWCDPDSLIQGHAAWHLLDAAAVACIFQFYRSERPRVTA